MVYPSVVNIKKEFLKKRGFDDFQDWNSLKDTLYIGRNMSFYVPGTFKSKWANPFSVKKYGREKCLELYEDHVRNTLWDQLFELENMELGCFCHPEPCHGNVLQRLYKEKRKSLKKSL